MAVQVQLWGFSKRRNSTAVPTHAASVTAQCVWKEPLDILHPVIDLAIDHGTGEHDDYKILDANYARFESRYYWISSITNLCLNHWRLFLEVDVLASWRTSIKRTTVFALYSENAGSGQLIDSRLPRVTDGASKMWRQSFPWLYDSTGYRVLAIQGKSGIDYFSFRSQATIDDLLNNADDWLQDIMHNVPLGDIEDESTSNVEGATDDSSIFKEIVRGIAEFKISINDALVKGFNSLIKGSQTAISTGQIGKSILGAMFFPWNIGPFLLESKKIYLGQYPTMLSAPTVKQTPVQFTVSLVTDSISWFDEIYLRRTGFCIWSAYIPFLGRVALPNEIMGPNRQVNFTCSVNVVTGVMRVKLSVGQLGEIPGETIGEFSTQVGFPYMVGASAVDVGSMIGNTISSISGGLQSIGGMQTGIAMAAATKSPAGIGMAYNSAVSGIGTAAQGMWGVVNDSVPNITAIGNASGSWFVTNDDYDFRVQCDYYGASCVPSSVAKTIGRPTFKNVDLSGYSGYIICSGASVSAPAYASEVDSINSYLNSGCYIE